MRAGAAGGAGFSGSAGRSDHHDDPPHAHGVCPFRSVLLLNGRRLAAVVGAAEQLPSERAPQVHNFFFAFLSTVAQLHA